MKSKKMKVLYSARARQAQYVWGRESYYTATPKISMEGKWLEALGFHIGDAIEVSYEDNCVARRIAGGENGRLFFLRKNTKRHFYRDGSTHHSA